MSGDRVPLLLIEDNPADLRLLAELLEEAAPGLFRVEPARRLSEGLEALRTGPFAAIILDLSLPDTDGVGAIRIVREAAPSTPVIVLSGLLDGEVRRVAAEQGAAASFVKGEESIAPLVAAIDELIRECP
ncbi:MAG: response regulator [Methanospirillum sp.]